MLGQGRIVAIVSAGLGVSALILTLRGLILSGQSRMDLEARALQAGIGELLRELPAAIVPQVRQLPRVVGSAGDRLRDLHAGLARDGRHRAVHPNVHLMQRPLNPLRETAALRYQIL